MQKLLKNLIYILTTILLLTIVFLTSTKISATNYERRVKSLDLAGNQSPFTSSRSFVSDYTLPIIYFTGSTPASGTISANTTFTGEVEIIEPHLSRLIRNRNGTQHFLNMNDHRNIFTPWNYSRTNYEETGLVLAMNFDNLTGFGEDTSTIKDFSQNNYTGSTINNPTRIQTGKYNWAYSFNQSDTEYINIPNTIESWAINYTTWFKASITWEDNRLFKHIWNWFYINFKTQQRPLLYLNTSNYIYFNYIKEYLDNERHFLSLSLPWTGQNDTRLARLFIDNNEIGKYTSLTTVPQWNRWDVNIWRDFSWEIDDFRIYNHVLSTWARTQLYATNITKSIDETRSFTIKQENLPDGTYTYQACAEDIVWQTGCTDTGLRSYIVQSPKTITIKTANEYTSTGDFRLFEQTGASSRRQVFNSSKISTDSPININYSPIRSSGFVYITWQLFPNSGETYLTVFKLNGALAVGYTGVWQEIMTGFNFSDANKINIYPKLEYEWINYLTIGDVDTDDIGTYDYIHGADLVLINNNLTRSVLQNITLYDFDHNSTTNAIEQAMIIQYSDYGGYIKDYLPNWLTSSDFKSF